MSKYITVFFIILFFSTIAAAQDNFLELPEQVYVSALSDDKKTLAVASKRSVYLINI